MKRSLLNKWIERLEDPNTMQGKGGLRTLHGFCCLGVLCDIVDPTGWNKDQWGWFFNYKQNITIRGFLPPILAQENGMEPIGISSGSREAALSTLNDGNYTFQEIAKILREKPLNYIRSIEEDVS